jgi:hypothetical protein
METFVAYGFSFLGVIFWAFLGERIEVEVILLSVG